MNLFDALFIVLLAFFVLLSLLRGAMREVLTLAGLSVGVVAAVHFTGRLAAELEPFLPSAQAAGLLSFALLVLAGYFVGAFLGGTTESSRSGSHGAVGRVVAAVCGLGKGLLACVVVYLGVTAYVPPLQDEVLQARAEPYLARLADWLQGLPIPL